MKRWIALTLVLLMLVAPGMAGQPDIEAFAGAWHQSNGGAEPWTVELNKDGTGSMHNSQQDIPLTWEISFYAPDLPPIIDTYADFGDGKMSFLDSWTYKDGVLKSAGGMTFDRGVPDIVFIEPYPQAKFAPKTAFDGVWEMTGGLLTVTEPPISMELSLAEFGLKPPVYIGIKDGRIATSNQGATVTEDPGIISYYAGNAIYAGRALTGITGIFYYVGNDTIHLRYTGPANQLGVDVTFTLYKTKRTDVPPSADMMENFPWDPDFITPGTP